MMRMSAVSAREGLQSGTLQIEMSVAGVVAVAFLLAFLAQRRYYRRLLERHEVDLHDRAVAQVEVLAHAVESSLDMITISGLDDRITIELDPYHNHRSISRFTVTARGTQSDAMALKNTLTLQYVRFALPDFSTFSFPIKRESTKEKDWWS